MSATTDAIIAQLRADGGPVTRDRYIWYIYFGTPPDELTAEEESEIPDYPWDEEPTETKADAGDSDGTGS
jgi:hypothetical protein